MEKKEPALHCWWEFTCCSYYGEYYGMFLWKLKLELPYEPAVPLLGIHSEKTLTWKDIHILSLLAVVFTIARIWKQPNVHTYVNGHVDVTHTHTHTILLSKKIKPFSATWMNLKIIKPSEVNQRQIIWYHLYVEPKIWYKWTYLQYRNRLIDRKQTWLPNGKVEKGWIRNLD